MEEETLATLVEAATFKNMRSNFEKYVPGVSLDFWHDGQKFLNKGKSGQWQEKISSDLNDRFLEKLNALAAPEQVAWLLSGGQD